MRSWVQIKIMIRMCLELSEEDEKHKILREWRLKVQIHLKHWAHNIGNCCSVWDSVLWKICFWYRCFRKILFEYFYGQLAFLSIVTRSESADVNMFEQTSVSLTLLSRFKDKTIHDSVGTMKFNIDLARRKEKNTWFLFSQNRRSLSNNILMSDK